MPRQAGGACARAGGRGPAAPLRRRRANGGGLTRARPQRHARAFKRRNPPQTGRGIQALAYARGAGSGRRQQRPAAAGEVWGRVRRPTLAGLGCWGAYHHDGRRRRAPVGAQPLRRRPRDIPAGGGGGTGHGRARRPLWPGHSMFATHDVVVRTREQAPLDAAAAAESARPTPTASVAAASSPPPSSSPPASRSLPATASPRATETASATGSATGSAAGTPSGSPPAAAPSSPPPPPPPPPARSPAAAYSPFVRDHDDAGSGVADPGDGWAIPATAATVAATVACDHTFASQLAVGASAAAAPAAVLRGGAAAQPG